MAESKEELREKERKAKEQERRNRRRQQRLMGSMRRTSYMVDRQAGRFVFRGLRKLISGFVFIFIALAFIYAFVFKPTYGNKVLNKMYEIGDHVKEEGLNIIRNKDNSKDYIPKVQEDENGRIQIKEGDAVKDSDSSSTESGDTK